MSQSSFSLACHYSLEGRPFLSLHVSSLFSPHIYSDRTPSKCVTLSREIYDSAQNVSFSLIEHGFLPWLGLPRATLYHYLTSFISSCLFHSCQEISSSPDQTKSADDFWRHHSDHASSCPSRVNILWHAYHSEAIRARPAHLKIVEQDCHCFYRTQSPLIGIVVVLGVVQE